MSRLDFQHEGRTIYQWDQSLDEVNLYIAPPKQVLPKYRDALMKKLPPGQNPPKLTVKIEPHSLSIGIEGNPPYLQEKLAGVCDRDESCWTIEDEQLHVTLVKASKALQWPCVFVGHELNDPLQAEATRKKILLERFQEEHPGFDFSGAEVNGMVPDPRTFMGGMHSD